MLCRFAAGFLLFCFGFLFHAAAQNAPANPTASIRGTVIDTRTGQPIAGATVVLRGQWGTPGRSSTSTGPDGMFSLRGLPPGRYRIEASQSGYVDSRGRDGFRGFSPNATISLGDGQHVDDVVVRLAPAGMIAGKVVNDAAQPLTGILVSAMKASYRDGSREFSDSHTSFTDDHGEFRITGLAPGHYFIKATAPRGWEKGPAPAQVYVPVFYPGVTDPAQTQPVDLRPGDELNAINLTLNLQRAVHVKGRIVTANGRGAKTAEVSLTQLPSSGYTIEAEADAAGRFDIAAVPPGSYVLEAQLSEDTDPARVFMGRATVSVAESAVEVPDVMVFPGAKVPGHITVAGDRKVSMGRMRASLNPISSSYAGDVTTTIVQPDGSFEFTDVPEGSYRVHLSSTPDGFYRKQNDIAGTTVVVSHGHAAAVEIRLDSGAGQITGSIYSDGESQNPAPGAAVVLIPDASRRSISEDFRFATADRSGKFILKSVPPGEYLILAAEEIERDSFMAPEFIQAYEDSGKSVRVEEGDSLRVDLQTTPQ